MGRGEGQGDALFPPKTSDVSFTPADEARQCVGTQPGPPKSRFVSGGFGWRRWEAGGARGTGGLSLRMDGK